MSSPFIRLVLASRNPRRLAHFYGELVHGGAVTVAPAGAAAVRLPTGMDMVLYRPSRQRPQPRQGGCLALCLRCTRLEDTRQRAMALGAQVLEPLREEPFGREQWLLDPEGNRVLLWEDP
ncbi:MAG TPA: glyoxalase/bleomycin resistance/dioxygenase family protein [Synechococcus sp. UBA8638]|uniref:VOC family protein n=1 Tax=Candidatus Synechococcus spongiarum TaxID=431041 RepID=UPI000472F27F|nr:VOC family protein [Candidatus Synechococcus spongiarum]HBP53211.1 glyoxalase/bleomycin resistance/dioxygenase family protein [Synechococcus sp. UBA8638]